MAGLGDEYNNQSCREDSAVYLGRFEDETQA